MTLQLNGQAKELDDTTASLEGLLKSLDLLGRPVVVELNGQPVLPDAYAEVTLADGDRLEIVRIAAGG
jgi:thiazole synthase